MNTIGKKELIPAFKKYIAEYKKLEVEYSRIPNWRIFKQLRNIKKRETLTRIFTTKSRKWDL